MKTSKELVSFICNATCYTNRQTAFFNRGSRAQSAEFKAYANGWREKNFFRREKRYNATLKRMERNLRKQASKLSHLIEVGDAGEFFGYCVVSSVKCNRITVVYPDEDGVTAEVVDAFDWLYYNHYNLHPRR